MSSFRRALVLALCDVLDRVAPRSFFWTTAIVRASLAAIA